MPKRTAHIFEEKWRSDDVKLQEATDFSSLLISERVLLGLKKAGYKNPSPIQVDAVPVGRFGSDLVVQAKSGTGKTLVFTIVALDTLNIELKVPQVLILAPTREIAFQICDVIKAVGCTTDNLKCGTFIGGLPVEMDLLNIQGCQIVVGTPGRITQLMELKILKAHSIHLLVLDEADQLLEASFKSSMDAIFQSLPVHKQIIATSATYPKSLAKLVDVYFKPNPTIVRLNESDLALLGIVHFTCLVENSQMPVLAYRRKLQALETVLTSVKFSQCLVFCNQVSRVETLCSDIKKFGFSVTYISSAKDQGARLKAIDSLKRFKCKILVSSDITSRGIDAENVDLIINVDIPYTTEVYLHRVGRAGRYGSKGAAITFVTLTEQCSFSRIQEDGNFIAYELPDPVPEKLINWRPKTKFIKEKSNDWKSSLSENLNSFTVIQKDKTVSNGIDDTLFKSNAAVNQNISSEDFAINQNISSEDSALSQNISSEDTAVNQNVSSDDTAVNQNISSEDSALNQNISSEDSALNQNISSEDSALNQNISSEDSALNQNISSEDSSVSESSKDTSITQSTSSEDASFTQSTSTEDASMNQTSTSEDTSVNQSTTSEDVSVNQSTTSKDVSADQDITSVNQNTISEDTSVNQDISSNTSVNQSIYFEETFSTNTDLTAICVAGVNQSSVDKESDKISRNPGDIPAVNPEDAISVDEVNKKSVLNKCKGKKFNNGTKVLKQKKSSSIAVSSSEQNCLGGSGGKTEDSLSKNDNPNVEDEIIVFVMNFIDDYEKKNTADLSSPLVDNGDESIYLSSKKTNHPNNSPLIKRDLIDYYYKVFQAFKSDFIAANGAEQLELMMADNDEIKDEKCDAVQIEKDEMPVVDQMNLSLWAKRLGCSTFNESNGTDDSDVDSSAKDILVSTPNAKTSRANNTQLVVSSDTPPFLNSVDYEDTGDSSSSKYSSKCLQLENACKSKIGTVNKKQVSKDLENHKSKVQNVVSSDTESSETTSSSDTDAENVHNIKRSAVNKKQVFNHFENPMRGTQNIESSDTESETDSPSDTDSSSKVEESNNFTLLERGFREMMKSKKKKQSLAEQADQLKQILQKIESERSKSGKGSDSDSLSGIFITTAGAHSSLSGNSLNARPLSHCKTRRGEGQPIPQSSFNCQTKESVNKSLMKTKSSKISRNAGLASDSGNKLKGQRSKYQSEQEDSVSYSSKSKFSEKQRVAKVTKEKTHQRAKGLPTQLNRNEDPRAAEPYNFYFNQPHISRHVDGSHFSQYDHFQNAVYPNTGHNIGSRPSKYPCHHSYNNHHGNCPNAAFAVQNSRSQPSQCRHSHSNHQGHLQNASCSGGHSRSIQHFHGMNGSPAAHPLLNDMYYRQWYWMQQGSFFQ